MRQYGNGVNYNDRADDMKEHYYRDFGTWIRQRFPFRVQKLSINAGFSCPNRDGHFSTGGCIYCDNSSFSPSYCNKMKSITEQLEEGKRFFSRKYPTMKYLAYFQSYTNTYASIEKLKRLYSEAIHVDDVIGIAIGTRPDCVSEELLDYLADLNKRSFVMVEYGVESANDDTLRRINRGHDFACALKAVKETRQRGIMTGAHVILGLPGEDEKESIRQAPLINAMRPDILKIHQMQIIQGTKLAHIYQDHSFKTYTINEYIRLIANYIQYIDKDIVLDRFVSQSPGKMLLAPKWGLKNHEFTALLNRYLEKEEIHQGDKCINVSENSRSSSTVLQQ